MHKATAEEYLTHHELEIEGLGYWCKLCCIFIMGWHKATIYLHKSSWIISAHTPYATQYLLYTKRTPADQLRSRRRYREVSRRLVGRFEYMISVNVHILLCTWEPEMINKIQKPFR